MKPLILSLFLLSLIAFPGLSIAQEPQYTDKPVEGDTFTEPEIVDGVIKGDGFVPCSGTGCSACDFVVLANTLIKWFIGISFLLFAVLAFVAGIKLVTSQGNPGELKAAKSSFTGAFIGLFIIFAAWLLVDTLIRQLVPGDGNVSGYGPWSEVQCGKQAVSTTVEGYYEGDPLDLVGTTGGAGATSGAGAGKCTVVTDSTNACHPSKLGIFGTDASRMSAICARETGGRPLLSTVDVCADGSSFSGGYFQVNVISNYDKIPGCSKSFLKNPSAGMGQCLKCKSGAVVGGKCTKPDFCVKWSCEIADRAMYNTCIQGAKNAETNFALAKRVYNTAQKANGDPFWPWKDAGGSSCQNITK